MDGAQCLVAENGDVSIGPHKTHRLIFSASAVAGLVWGIGLALGFSAPARSWFEGPFLLGAILLAGVCILAFQSLGQMQIHVSPVANEIAARRGFRIRRYPFGRVSHIRVLIHNKMTLSVHRTYMLRTAEPIAEIEFILADELWIPLGKCSGREAENRALSVSRHVAEAIGVPVRKVYSAN